MKDLEHFERGSDAGKSEKLPLGKRFLTRNEVLAVTTWSISTLRRREQEGLFPQHVRDKGRALWAEDEVVACIEEMKQGRGETAWQVRREERKQQAEIQRQEQATDKNRAELEELAHSPRIRPRRAVTR